MLTIKNLVFLIIISVFFVGCGGAIQNYSILNKQQDKELIASKGSILFRVDKSSDLPNAFGKADIYGGKVDRGFTEVKLIDIIDNKILKLSIVDISKNSSQTTMDRYGKQNLITVSTQINSQNNYDNANIVLFDTTKDNFLIVGDIKLTIIKTTSFNLYYKLSK